MAGLSNTPLRIGVRTAKEAARHLLNAIGLRALPPYLRHEQRRDRFDEIYRAGVWRLGDETVPLSGNGSSVHAASAIMRALPGLLDDLPAKSLLDVGCGDMTWMSQVSLPRYIGIDVVPAVIEANIRSFPGREFHCIDAVCDPLPHADAALCREVLFHLSFDDAHSLLRNLRRTGVEWLLATTDASTMFNAEIVSGDFRLLNLHRAPFRFPSPLRCLPDDSVEPGRSIGVWRVDSLAL